MEAETCNQGAWWQIGPGLGPCEVLGQVRHAAVIAELLEQIQSPEEPIDLIRLSLDERVYT